MTSAEWGEAWKNDISPNCVRGTQLGQFQFTAGRGASQDFAASAENEPEILHQVALGDDFFTWTNFHALGHAECLVALVNIHSTKDGQFGQGVVSHFGLLKIVFQELGATVWLVQQCEAGTRIPLLDKPDSGTRQFNRIEALSDAAQYGGATHPADADHECRGAEADLPLLGQAPHLFERS